MKSYNNDLRERIVAGRQNGASAEELAQRFGVSKRSVERYWQRQQATGSIAPKQRGGYRRSVLEGHDEQLRQWIQAEPGLTLAELLGRLRKQLKIKLGTTALWHRLERLDLSFKKTRRAAEQDRPELCQARAAWCQRRLEWNIERLVFLDETGLNTKMTRLYGRAERGARCLDAVPHGHWQTATFIAALRHDRLCAPLLLDGPMEGVMFVAYLERILAPELAPGDLVICDNLSSHKVRGAAEAVAACGAQMLYLPADSPDLNPIELAFAKLKAELRRAARRSWNGLCRATAKALEAFSPGHCRNFFRHAQYATS